MSRSPRELAELDWVVTPSGKVLHAPDDWGDDQGMWACSGKTECGISAWLEIPGLRDRLWMPRCERCCDLTGYPQGNGSPKNDDDCEEALTARFARLSGT